MSPTVIQGTSLRLPIIKESPLVRSGPALPTDPALRGLAQELIAEAKFAMALAATERSEAPGTLYGAMRTMLSTRTPEARERAQTKAKALLASPDSRAVFGRFSATTAAAYLKSSPAPSLTAFRADPAEFSRAIERYRKLHWALPESFKLVPPKTDPDLQAGLAYKKLRVFVTKVRCVEETSEIGSDHINIGAIKTTPFGETNISDEFTVSTDFDQGELVQYAGDGHKIAGWDLVTNQPWPVGYLVTVCVGEKDDGGFYKFLQDLWNYVRDEALALIAAGVGAAVGGALGGILGAVIGGVVGVIVGWIISLFDNEDDIVDAIPVTLNLGAATKSYYDWAQLTSAEGFKTTQHFHGDGGYYRVGLRYKVFTQ